MTRSRADALGTPSEFAPEYYAQRASSGLIITEGTQPSWQGQGYARTPGIHTDEQIEGWFRIAEAVHERGGRIFMQIMHVGRVAHPANRQIDDAPVAPSPVPFETTQMWTDADGMHPMPVARELETGEIQGILDEYAAAAEKAVAAGLDGVELHAASGYLPNQFLCSNTNHRTDRYGGSVSARIRFTLELLEAMSGAIGADRVGVKFSPAMGFNECLDENPEALFKALIPEVSRFRLAYLHVSRNSPEWDVHADLRPLFDGPYLAGGGLRAAADGQALLDAGHAEGTVWGWWYVSNPDLAERLKGDRPLADPDPSTFYTPGAKGYTDYPALASE